jgi:IclR family transcriptional regulator, KDG regulon repressor
MRRRPKCGNDAGTRSNLHTATFGTATGLLDTSSTPSENASRLEERGTGGVTSVVRALSILSAFDLDRAEVGVSQVADLVGLHKSTPHRLLATLESQGFVSKTKRSTYVLGRKIFELGAVAYTQGGFHGIVLEELGLLVERTNETAHLAVLDDVEVLYLEKVKSKRTLRMPSAVGRRQPAHRTALGKVLLAHLQAAGLERLHDRRRQDSGPARANAFMRELHAVRGEGYAVDREEFEVGLVCIAAPITRSGEACAAVSISGPKARLGHGVEAKATLVRECCSALSIRLGSRLEWLCSYRVETERSPGRAAGRGDGASPSVSRERG